MSAMLNPGLDFPYLVGVLRFIEVPEVPLRLRLRFRRFSGGSWRFSGGSRRFMEVQRRFMEVQWRFTEVHGGSVEVHGGSWRFSGGSRRFMEVPEVHEAVLMLLRLF
jgi:hypothetical protein